jgi:type IV pilus assembly protein PilA
MRTRVRADEQNVTTCRTSCRRLRSERGFTLIELLVVILIIGILAGIAIPLFLSQKGKATDAAAKVLARTAQTAAETYAIDHEGKYEGVTIAELQAVDPTLREPAPASLIAVEPGAEGGYVIETKSTPTSNVFKIERTKAGEVVRTCTTAGKGGCPQSGIW